MSRKSPKPPSARAQRRAGQRDVRKLFEARTKLAALEPGGAAERAIEVPSASVVELRAASMPCARCGAEVRVVDHTAHAGAAEATVRAARVCCKACGYERRVWFRVSRAVLN
jgi:DNA-directed RNA polymerase subunit RPC12/RpoP